MNFGKTAFILGLLNFIVVVSIIVTFKRPVNETVVVNVIPTLEPVKRTIKTVTLAPQTVTTQTSTPTIAASIPTPDTRCIILVDGVKYDISVFRNRHSGGDIFQCNTDMSQVFHQQHSNGYLQSMSQYRI